MKIKENKMIENYAQSLLKHNLYPTINKARKEAKRWYKKHINGLEEPLLYPHHPDIEPAAILTKTDDGITIEYKYTKN